MELLTDPVTFEEGVLDYRASPYRYKGRAGQAVRLLKYNRRTALADFMSKEVAHLVEKNRLDYDLAVPVPIHWYRRAYRGFNQAELLSSKLERVAPLLKRRRATMPQAGLTVEQRLFNLRDAFQVIGDVKGKSILLVDDVLTSGQTAVVCAETLKSAGATEVGVVTFCGQDWL